jgi:hypothetical protein
MSAIESQQSGGIRQAKSEAGLAISEAGLAIIRTAAAAAALKRNNHVWRFKESP